MHLRNMMQNVITQNHLSTIHICTSNENNDDKNSLQQLDKFIRIHHLFEQQRLHYATKRPFLSRSPNSSVMLYIVIFLFIPVAINGAVSFDAQFTLADTRRFRCSRNSDRTFYSEKIVDMTMDVESEVTFHLFTNSNKEKGQLLKVGDLQSLEQSNFDPEYETKIVVHGWTDCVNTQWYDTYRRNYLNTGNYNLILVDWSSGSNREYFTSSKLTLPVGEQLGKFLVYLEENYNASLSTFHILGHSLGAHIAGIAGSVVSGRVGRVTGMDPASPGFEVPFLVHPKDRLDPTDAEFVDVIHTCSGTAGFTMPIGHVDFYPNGGTFTQPGCPPIMSQFCSHARSHQFMSESIIRPRGFLALRCDSWRDLLFGHCDQDEKVLMGEIVNHETRGTFYLRTNPQQPFGRSE